MRDIAVIGIGVMIAAFIGGMTNYVAIKMLFHPRRPWFVAGRKMPFTPGLIPKRRVEIAQSFGYIVSNYLVTSSGIRDLLVSQPFVQAIVDRLIGQLRLLGASDMTIKEAIGFLWREEEREEKVNALLRQISTFLSDWSGSTLAGWWDKSAVAGRTIGELTSRISEDERQRIWARAADLIADGIREELFSPRGERLLVQLTSQLLERAGGFLGAMASIFMDEHKLAGKVRIALADALAGPGIRLMVAQFIRGRWEEAEQLTWREAVTRLTGKEDLRDSLVDLGRQLDWEGWIRRGGEYRIGELMEGQLQWLEGKIPTFVAFLLQLIARNTERIIAALKLEELVEAQVHQFPIERLESVILSVSGKEFRAITWLGALLGAMIGLVQTLLLRWLS